MMEILDALEENVAYTLCCHETDSYMNNMSHSSFSGSFHNFEELNVRVKSKDHSH